VIAFIKNILIITTLFTITIVFSWQLTPIRNDLKKEFRKQTEVTVPSSLYYDISSFGFDVFRSDILFMKTIQYVGDYYSAEKLFYLEDYISRITDLDPHFIFPYKFCAFVLSDTTKNGAVTIMEKGLKDNPDSWEIPFYLGYMYLIEIGDYEKASEYFDIAATKEGVLPAVEKLSAQAKKKAGLYENSLIFWINIFENSNDLGAKKQAQKEIEQLQIFISESEKILNYMNESKISSSQVDISILREHNIIELPELSDYYFYNWNEEGYYIEVMEMELEEIVGEEM